MVIREDRRIEDYWKRYTFYTGSYLFELDKAFDLYNSGKIDATDFVKMVEERAVPHLNNERNLARILAAGLT